MSELNIKIKEAIDSFDTDKARELLRDAMKEADAETYFLASKVALDDDQKKEFLQKAIELDPFHEKANKALKAGTDITTQTSSNPADKASSTDNQDQAKNYIEATISRKSEIYILPNYRSEIRTTVESNTVVYLVSRFEDFNDSRWYQVIYNSPVTTVVGWVEHIQIRNLNLNGVQIQPMDLPKTEWQFNKRDEVKDVIKKIQQARQKGVVIFLIAGFAVGFVIGLLLNQSDAIFFGFMGMSGGVIYFSLFRSEGRLMWKEFRSFQKISKEARTDHEKMRDDQLTNMALNAALNLGVSATTRMIPNKQDIRIRK